MYASDLLFLALQDADNPTGLRLKYLSLKNLASISLEEGDTDGALSFFVQVSLLFSDTLRKTEPPGYMPPLSTGSL